MGNWRGRPPTVSRAQAFSLWCAAIGGGGGGVGGVGVISGVGVVGGGGARQLFVVSAFRCVSHVAIFTLCLSARFSRRRTLCSFLCMLLRFRSADGLFSLSAYSLTARVSRSQNPPDACLAPAVLGAPGGLHRLRLPSPLAAAFIACSCHHCLQLPSPLTAAFAAAVATEALVSTRAGEARGASSRVCCRL